MLNEGRAKKGKCEVIKSLQYRCKKQLNHALGAGESQAQVTSTLPRIGSASFWNAPGLRSISLAAQPVPVLHQWDNNSFGRRIGVTSIDNRQIHTSASAYPFVEPCSPDLEPT